MRIVVVGTSGSGKTTLATAIASALNITHIELDALHWGPGWNALSLTNPDEFQRRVRTAINDDHWVVDGNYNAVRDVIWREATHLVWLDYGRPIVMARVIRRSLMRAIMQKELWAGNKESWRSWWRPSHPIPWAWRTWQQRRVEIDALSRRDEYRHLAVIRVRKPREAADVIHQLKTQRSAAN